MILVSTGTSRVSYHALLYSVRTVRRQQITACGSLLPVLSTGVLATPTGISNPFCNWNSNSLLYSVHTVITCLLFMLVWHSIHLNLCFYASTVLPCFYDTRVHSILTVRATFSIFTGLFSSQKPGSVCTFFLRLSTCRLTDNTTYTS